MTNYEKYKDFIRERAKSNESFGIIDDTPKDCRDMSCIKCIFNDSCYVSSCASKHIFEFFTWLDTEVKEPYVLTEEELAFCLMAKTGYLWRDTKYDYLFYFKEKPVGNSSLGYDGERWVCLEPPFFPSFDFVKNELVSIENILNNYTILGDK